MKTEKIILGAVLVWNFAILVVSIILLGGDDTDNIYTSTEFFLMKAVAFKSIIGCGATMYFAKRYLPEMLNGEPTEEDKEDEPQD